MGLTTTLLSHAAVTTLALGFLKRKGIVVVDPSKIEGDYTRQAFIKAISAGEECVVFGERLYASVYEQIVNASKK